MGILKGFMIFGAVCYMFIAFAESKNEEYFLRDMVGMLGCSFVAILINFIQKFC